MLYSITANAQNDRDWALGISLSPSLKNGNAISIDALRKYNSEWQLEFKSFYWFYKNQKTSTLTEKSHAFGATIGTRLILLESNIFRPYLLVSLGFAYQVSNDHNSWSHYTFNYDHWYIIYSFRVGSEVIINQSSWSIDFNFGYLGLIGLEAGDQGQGVAIISLGVLKRLTKKTSE